MSDANDLRAIKAEIRQELRKFSASLDRTEPNPNRLWTRKDVAAFLSCSYGEARKWLIKKKIPLADAPGDKYQPALVVAAAEKVDRK
jgi:predicted oxidoreductase